MIETQRNAHILMNEFSSSSSKARNLPEGCKRNDMIMNMNKGHIDTAAPCESVKEAVGKFKGLRTWEDHTDMSIEEMLRLNSHGGTSANKIMRSESAKKYTTDNVGQIDTAAPIESVKAAVNKFGRTESLPAPSTLERQKSLHDELEKLQEELLEQRKESDVAEDTKGHVLAALESTMMLIEDLKLSLQNAESQEAQARKEFWLVKQNLGARELEIARSAARWSKLQAAKERVQAELSSAKRELESMEEVHAATVAERNDALRKAKEHVSESMAMERTMESLRLVIGSTKESAELARLASIKAEKQKDAAAAEFELEKLSCEMEMKRADDKLAKLNAALLVANDLKSKAESSSASLRDVRSELSSFMEAKGTRTKELEKARRLVEKANVEVDSLKATASQLKSTLETEKSTMDATRKREGSASASVPALEAEIESTKAGIELVQRREEEAKVKAEVLPRALDQAKEEADQAKLMVKSANEALKKAEEEAELTKAEANTMEKRLDAARKEIEAANASTTMANSTATAMKESKHAKRGRKNGVTLSLKDYLELRRKAAEAEETAKNRVATVIEQIKEAKESELQRQQELEEAKQAIHERKRGLQAAAEETERTNTERGVAEQELRERTAREGQERKAIIPERSLSGPAELEEAAGGGESRRVTAGCKMARSSTMITVGDVAKQKRKSRSFFPLFNTLWGKKKNQSLS